MTPKDYKGKTVSHPASSKIFTVAGGQKKGGVWFLKNDRGQLYPLEECYLADIDADQLKEINALESLQAFHQTIGAVRFRAAWQCLESDSVEIATLALLYCSTWEEFQVVAEANGVSKTQSDPKDPSSLSARFMQRCKDKGLDRLIKTWYRTKESAA